LHGGERECKKQDMGRLSFILLEFRELEAIRASVERLRATAGAEGAEIVVSSNSGYGEAERAALRAEMPGVKWVFNERNGGFGYGMNRGMEAASGDLLVAMNADAAIEKGLGEMAAFFEAHPEVGLAGPLMRGKNGRVQDSFRRYTSVPRFAWRQLRRCLGAGGNGEVWRVPGAAVSVDWVIGACMVLRRETFRRTGGFDEGYFLYVEDEDLCARVRQGGEEVAFVPAMEVRYQGTRLARRRWDSARVFLRSLRRFWGKFGAFGGYPRRKPLAGAGTEDPPRRSCAKRAFDIAVSALGLVAFSPVLLLCALAVKLGSKGPVLYVSDRIGASNRHFGMLKFRTMRQDAPEVATHLLSQPDAWLTGCGKFLRRTSLDELPQLANVLMGDMSIVGPRPALFNQDDQISMRTAAGCHVLVPGITGWAQVNGRDEISIERKVELDTWYFRHQSFALDMKILWITAWNVLAEKGVSH